MRSSIIIIAALTATAQSLQMLEAPNRANEAIAAAGRAIKERRDLDACTSVATSILPKITDNVPTAPADVASYLAFSVTITDPCSDPKITGSIGSAFSSYASEYTSWRNKHISDYRALWQACSDVPGIVNVLPTGSDQCSSLVAEITSAGSGNGGTKSPNAAGPRETGAIVAAAAMAGFVVAAVQ
ncbi:hypothetical protein EsH8_VI_000244 [Colletotrichum jinshuiense]